MSVTWRPAHESGHPSHEVCTYKFGEPVRQPEWRGCSRRLTHQLHKHLVPVNICSVNAPCDNAASIARINKLSLTFLKHTDHRCIAKQANNCQVVLKVYGKIRVSFC